MDGLAVLILLGGSAIIAALLAGAVFLPIVVAWDLVSASPRPQIINLIGLAMFAVVWCGVAGRSFANNGMNSSTPPYSPKA